MMPSCRCCRCSYQLTVKRSRVESSIDDDLSDSEDRLGSLMILVPPPPTLVQICIVPLSLLFLFPDSSNPPLLVLRTVQLTVHLTVQCHVLFPISGQQTSSSSSCLASFDCCVIVMITAAAAAAASRSMMMAPLYCCLMAYGFSPLSPSSPSSFSSSSECFA